jgi:hypothetical protein
LISPFPQVAARDKEVAEKTKAIADLAEAHSAELAKYKRQISILEMSQARKEKDMASTIVCSCIIFIHHTELIFVVLTLACYPWWLIFFVLFTGASCEADQRKRGASEKDSCLAK